VRGTAGWRLGRASLGQFQLILANRIPKPVDLDARSSFSGRSVLSSIAPNVYNLSEEAIVVRPGASRDLMRRWAMSRRTSE
jgi:hypothetical protein